METTPTATTRNCHRGGHRHHASDPDAGRQPRAAESGGPMQETVAGRSDWDVEPAPRLRNRGCAQDLGSDLEILCVHPAARAAAEMRLQEHLFELGEFRVEA